MEPSKTSQTRWERLHKTFTLSLNLVPFCQLCTIKNSLHTHQMNKVFSTGHSTAFHIKDNPYTQHCSHFVHTRQTIPAVLSRNYIASTHNITHSPCTSTCTTHPAMPSPLPSTILLCIQLTNTKHSWQNGTRCRDGVNVLWCRSHLVWFLRVPSLHAFVFNRKTLL